MVGWVSGCLGRRWGATSVGVRGFRTGLVGLHRATFFGGPRGVFSSPALTEEVML